MVGKENSGSYRNLSEQFLLTQKDKKGAFNRQYFELYDARLKSLKGRILENAENVLGKGNFECVSLTDVTKTKDVLVIGMILKKIAAKPSILKTLLSEDKVAYEDYEDEEAGDLKRYTENAEDHLEFECDNQTVKLEGNISMNDCATGCCAGLFGKLGDEDGVFEVIRVIWPKIRVEPIDLKMKMRKSVIAFVSGLELSGDLEEDNGTISSFEYFGEWLKEEEEMNVERLVVLGPSIDNNVVGCDVESVVRTLTLSRQDKQMSTKALTMLDKIISSLTDQLDVDVSAGVGDPCSSLWPQPPIHRVCLPRSGMTKKQVNLVTNPYEFSLDGIRFLTTSGENIDDLLKTCWKWKSVDAMENCLKWQHIAPTCPDTLDGFPMADRDPLIISTTPRFMICGNQSNCEVRNVALDDRENICTCISIPKFSKSRTILFLNLEDLTVSWRVFQNDF
ncbi:unnamed protein product [Caenorhabditis angaria]|uniref:DNA polymerase alpha/delta/epsilon subunit B domain-containing protein n=1 Tax=Caenorhabditis angaria TaxID=860376 RepID=A0A9P1N4P1_9PELO|nr:unnamed protein product [Caenorhabditis angaria]